MIGSCQSQFAKAASGPLKPRVCVAAVAALLVAGLTLFAARCAGAALVMDAPGHVCVEGQGTVARGGEPGVGWMVLDWRGRPTGVSGTFDASGNAALPPMPAGYYRIVAESRIPNSQSSIPASLATLAVVAPPPVQPRNGGFYAADTGPIWEVARGESFLCPWNGGDAQRTLAELAWLCGLSHVRDRISPGGVTPKPEMFLGSYFFRSAELFHERGMTVCETYAKAPDWTAPRQKMPTDLAALYAMCATLVSGFGERVETWEFWNEPDIGFAPGPVWDYAAAMKAAYLGYKAARPDVVALSAALCTSPGNWYMRTLMANDAAKFTDAFNYHTYSPIAAYPAKFGALRRFLAEAGMDDPAIWLTEIGPEVEGAAEGEGAMPQFKAHTPAQELVVAEYCPKALVALQMEGIARAYWFILGAYNERGGKKDWGMLRRDGSAKPSFAALATIIRELGDARLLGELDVGPKAKAYLFEHPDGLQTVAFWAVSPVDTAAVCPDAEPDFAREVVLRTAAPAAVDACRLTDLCGMVSAVSATNGALVLSATRFPSYLSGLRGMVADHPAHSLGALGAPAPDEGEDLSVIVRVELDEDDWDVTRNKTRAVPKGGTGRLRVIIWNLGDESKTGTVEIAGGKLEGLPVAPFALGPRGGPPARFDCTFVPGDDGLYDTDLILRGRFNGRIGSRTCVPSWLERRFLAGSVGVPLDWRNLGAWAQGDPAGRPMLSWDDAEKAVRFDWEWLDRGAKRLAYPEYRLAEGESLAGARLVTFEVKSAQDKVENDFDRAYVMLGDLEIAFQPPNGNWETRSVELPPEGLGAFRTFRLGANPRGSKVTFWIRNLEVVKRE